jgi:hypothetical protein
VAVGEEVVVAAVGSQQPGQAQVPPLVARPAQPLGRRRQPPEQAPVLRRAPEPVRALARVQPPQVRVPVLVV